MISNYLVEENGQVQMELKHQKAVWRYFQNLALVRPAAAERKIGSVAQLAACLVDHLACR